MKNILLIIPASIVTGMMIIAAGILWIVGKGADVVWRIKGEA